MVKHLKMQDVDNLLVDKSVYLVVEINTYPVVTLVTTEYVEAKANMLIEENRVMLSMSPETVARAKSGELLDLRV